MNLHFPKANVNHDIEIFKQYKEGMAKFTTPTSQSISHTSNYKICVTNKVHVWCSTYTFFTLINFHQYPIFVIPFLICISKSKSDILGMTFNLLIYWLSHNGDCYRYRLSGLIRVKSSVRYQTVFHLLIARFLWYKTEIVIVLCIWCVKTELYKNSLVTILLVLHFVLYALVPRFSFFLLQKKCFVW